MTSDRTTIRDFVTARIGQPAMRDDTDLFETGLASSLFAVQIVMWLDRVLKLPVGAEDLDIRNFSSIDAITDFVGRKRAC